MGLFVKLVGKNQKSNEETALTRQTVEKSIMDQSDIEKAIAARNEQVNLSDCLQFSFADIAALGTGFSQMIPSLRTISFSNPDNKPLYYLINANNGESLKPVKKENLNILGGSFIDKKTGKSTFANFIKADPQTMQLPVNPAVMMMAAMLVQIEKKLDNIQKTADNIMSFLELDKQAEQQGNINILNDSLQNYKYNWDNKQYLQNHHMKALDIKQKAEQNVIFYQKQIAQQIEKIPKIHLDSDVMHSLTDLDKLFRDYRMAVYMFGFSAFLEVMLLGNFLEEYMKQAAEKVELYNRNYQKQFSQCKELLQKLSTGSIQTQVFKALGGASKFMGKAIGNSSFFSKGPVDEWLQKGGQKLIEGQDAKVQKVVDKFNTQDTAGGEIFVDGIRNMDQISNQTTDILFDKDTLYIACAGATAG